MLYYVGSGTSSGSSGGRIVIAAAVVLVVVVVVLPPLLPILSHDVIHTTAIHYHYIIKINSFCTADCSVISSRSTSTRYSRYYCIYHIYSNSLVLLRSLLFP